MDQKRRLITIFFIVFIDLMGFSLILPLLPFYAETFGASPFIVGLLVAAYAGAQLLGAPILGRLSDRYGRRPVLIISITGTVIGFIMLGFANSLWILFASRLLDGFTGGNISVAQAYIADITSEKDRAKGFGLIGAAFGLGFIFGPAIGGTLSVYGFALPAFVAAAFSFLSLLGVIFFLPESLSLAERTQRAVQKQIGFSWKAIRSTLQRPVVGSLIEIRFLVGLAFALFQTMFALYAQYRLELDARSTGFILTYAGILLVIVQVGLVGRLARRFNDYWLIFGSSVLLGASLFAWAVAPSVLILLLILIPLAIGGGILNTIINSAISKAVAPEEVGGTLGLSASAESLTRVIAPVIGGFLLGSVGTWAPGIVSGVIMLGAVIFIWRKLLNRDGVRVDLKPQTFAVAPSPGD